MTLRTTLVLLSALALGAACSKKGEGGAASTSSGQADASAKLFARHILISYQGAEGSRFLRPKEEARQRAEAVLAQLKGGKPFYELAYKFGEDAAARRGGYLGELDRQKIPAALIDEVAKLKVGEYSGIVETPMGFHVVMREAQTMIEASQILIAWKGAVQAKASVTRTEGDAEAHAREVQKLASAPGADFAALAREHSDDPFAHEGGKLPPFPPGSKDAAIEQALQRLKPGEVSDVVHTGSGYVIVRRDK